MGDLQFNPLAQPGDPDYGMMYISQGDFGVSRFPALSHLLQTPGSVFGSTLRIDPLGNNSTNGQYGIPSDNPWASDGDSNTLGEVWSYGHRNAHRLFWDPEDGRLYNFDIGSDTTGSSFEEINVVEGGNNYGWTLREGTRAKASPEGVATVLPVNDDTLGFTYPVAQFGDNEGNAIAGGVAYRGVDPDLNGKMVFGDIVTGRLFYSSLNDVIAADNDDSFNAAGNPQIATAAISELTVIHNGVQKNGGMREIVQGLTGNTRVDLRFGTDGDREIYILTKTDGWIRRLAIVPIEGDFDGDLDVDGRDFLLWQRNFGTNVVPNEDGDGNNDGFVDGADLLLWQANYGQGGALTSEVQVPEPRSVILLLAVVSTTLAVARRSTPLNPIKTRQE
ncbi:MAG: PQQ-dependent sugar dehydrogenase [Bythopirellula sp.]|mgnify:CR=1 FL=1|nr:PQQ-dependent sugar dehydrogenase [Bythopirellula sp.]